MTDATTPTPDRPEPKRGNRAGRSAPVLVSGNKLTVHFGVVRQRIDQLTAQGVIERRSDGLFDQDQSRLKYFDHLRSEHRRSPRTQADADYVKVKTEMLQTRLMEKRRELVLQSDVNELTDQLCGVVLTHLSSMPARCAPRGDLVTRRNIERVVFEVRTEMAKVCQEMADKAGEPPLSEQG
jgi:hypothetical protein